MSIFRKTFFAVTAFTVSQSVLSFVSDVGTSADTAQLRGLGLLELNEERTAVKTHGGQVTVAVILLFQI